MVKKKIDHFDSKKKNKTSNKTLKDSQLYLQTVNFPSRHRFFKVEVVERK